MGRFTRRRAKKGGKKGVNDEWADAFAKTKPNDHQTVAILAAEMVRIVEAPASKTSVPDFLATVQVPTAAQ